MKISNGASKTYDPKKVEDAIYKKWEDSGYFSPEKMIENGLISENAQPFSIVLPPPNVTGYLHIGHAVMLAIQDILVRYHRMKGNRTLWVPGTDHAAIATQEKVERSIFEKEGKTRHDLGRKEFLKRVGQFAQDSHDTIVNQVKKMGASIDWSREAFTLDEERNLSVRTAFVKMYDDGIIYRGHRIVNWDPKLKTTVSDDEIERKTEKTTFYYLKYGPFEIGTARPETKFGDKYVVVHPDDKRYEKYKQGQKIELEWMNGPVTATVIKDEAIDMDFGTGAMTITPWHDATDFDIALRHNLEKEQIIDLDGKLMPIAKEFSGMEIGEAREKIIEKLDKKGLLVRKDENYVHDIAKNSRGDGVIEPQIMEQWFVNVNKEFKQSGKKTSLKKLMQDAVKSGAIEIIPKRFEKTYFHWIDNLRDWCISRQIWYGHRIPVWYKNSSKVQSSKLKVKENPKQEIYCGIEPPKGEDWTQDPDTLDTWFSSGLWTFSTLGWPSYAKASKDKPAKIGDLATYHPTSVMETGYDILFFWVARMVLMSTYLLEEVPFKKVYLHGLIRDEKGRKMSKSLGNVIDPLDVSKKFGTDAVRLSLVIGTTPGQDLKMSEEKIQSFRNFSNKLWNIARYSLTSYDDFKLLDELDKKEIKSLSDQWILSRLSETSRQVSEYIEKFQFSLAGETLKNFTWNEMADWYLEINKIEKNKYVLGYVLGYVLKLWHPFMPFVTEKIYQDITGKEKLLMVSKWPEISNDMLDKKTVQKFNSLSDIIIRIRNIRAIYKIDPKKILNISINAANDASLLENQKKVIQKLARVESVSFIKNNKVIKSATSISGENKIFVHLEGIIDIEKERIRLKDEINNLDKYQKSQEKKLLNENFVKNAPEDIVKKEKEKLKQAEEKIDQIKKQLENLE